MKERIAGRGKIISDGMTDCEPFNGQVSREKEGNRDIYSVDVCDALENSDLAGKTIYWLGSSVTYGFAGCGEAVPDFMAKRNGLISVKSTISGTTLADVAFGEEEDNPWQVRVRKGMPEEYCRLIAPLSYISRLEDFAKDGKPDLLVIQLSTNDSQFPRKYQGIIAEGFDESSFDISTTFGATQMILSKARRYWGCPVLIYTSPLLFTDEYKSMVDATKKIAEKWGAYLLDMNADEEFNTLGREHFDDWMSDPVHPLRRGYLEWWTPAFEKAIKEILR